MTCDCYCTNHAQKQVPPIIYQLIFEIWEKQLIIHKQCQTIHEQNHATEGKIHGYLLAWIICKGYDLFSCNNIGLCAFFAGRKNFSQTDQTKSGFGWLIFPSKPRNHLQNGGGVIHCRKMAGSLKGTIYVVKLPIDG